MAEFEPMRVTMKVTESDETHSMTAHEQTEQYSMKLTSIIEPKLSDDYADLTNKPSINDVTLEGDLTSADLGLQDTIYLTDDSAHQYIVTSMEEATVGGVHGFMLYAENVSWFFPDGVGLNTVLTSVNTAIAGKQPIGDYATNSALTSGLATKQPVGDYATNSDLNSGLAAKQNVLTFDSAPTSGSTNPVESGGVYTALAGKQNTIPDLADIRSGAELGKTAVQHEVDPTVPAWAKASSKPTYTASEVGALPASTTIPSKVSDLQNDSGFLTLQTLPIYSGGVS